MIRLRLFITGRTPGSERLVAELRRALDESVAESYELEIIDVFEDPDLAYDDMVLATPTLVRMLPLPIRRIVGDLSNRERVLAGLDLLGDGNGGPS